MAEDKRQKYLRIFQAEAAEHLQPQILLREILTDRDGADVGNRDRHVHLLRNSV